MKSFFTLLAIFVFGFCCKAQTETPASFKKGDQFISIAPLNLIDPVAANIELSYERMLSNDFGLKLSAGKIFMTDYLFEDNAISRNGFRLRLEGKKYVENVAFEQFYFGVQLSYSYVEENSIVDFGGCVYCDEYATIDTITGPGNTITYSINQGGYQDSIKIFRNTILLNFKMGFMEQLSPRLYIGGYVGIGVKLRLVDHFGRINNEDELSETRHPSSRRDEQGNTVIPSLPVNMEIIYRF